MDRLHSLKRLMDSLKDAYYDGDTVHIQFFVDYPPAKVSCCELAGLSAVFWNVRHSHCWEDWTPVVVRSVDMVL